MQRPSRALVGLSLLLALATASCAAPAASSPSLPPSSAAPSGTETAAPTASPTPGAPATATAAATIAPTPPVPTAGASLPPFACGKAVSQAGSVPIALMRGFAASNGSATGRIVFSFRPAGNVPAIPDVTVRPASPPFLQDPSGLPLAVKGTQFLEIVLHGGTALDTSLNPTFGGPFDVTLNGSPIVEVRRAGDFEAVSTFIVGLDGPPCVRILPPDGTSQVVIQVQTK